MTYMGRGHPSTLPFLKGDNGENIDPVGRLGCRCGIPLHPTEPTLATDLHDRHHHPASTGIRPMITPIITDQATGRVLWRVIDCATYCGIGPRTWANYHAGGRTPQPVAHLDGRTPLWAAEEVKAWHANRPGSPIKTTQ